MPQICTICRHEQRAEIDRDLLAGTPFRIIAERTGTSTTALHRHRKEHIPAALTHAKQAAAEVEAGTLFDRLRAINRETTAILREARESQNHVLALQAIARAEKQLELEARLLGDLSDSAKVAIGIAVEASPQLDLSVLTNAELEQCYSILEKAQGATKLRQ